VTCESCGDYRFVPGADGRLVRCPGCAPVACPVHGPSRSRLCTGCVEEARLALSTIVALEQVSA
jgi:hypothetical protein